MDESTLNAMTDDELAAAVQAAPRLYRAVEVVEGVHAVQGVHAAGHAEVAGAPSGGEPVDVHGRSRTPRGEP